MDNIDASELSKFAELADQWWDHNGDFKSLHDINPLRVSLIEDSVGGLFAKKTLDVGCGGGILSEALAHNGADVDAIDMVQDSLDVANLHKLESGAKVNYSLTTAETWAESHLQHYDLVCCLEMLEHVPDPASIVRACTKMCKPGGKVIFSTINRNAKAYTLAIAAAEYLLGMVPKGTHDFNKFIRPNELLEMVENSGLTAKSITGLHFNPLAKKYYLSDKNVDVNYFIVCDR